MTRRWTAFSAFFSLTWLTFSGAAGLTFFFSAAMLTETGTIVTNARITAKRLRSRIIPLPKINKLLRSKSANRRRSQQNQRRTSRNRGAAAARGRYRNRKTQPSQLGTWRAPPGFVRRSLRDDRHVNTSSEFAD